MWRFGAVCLCAALFALPGCQSDGGYPAPGGPDPDEAFSHDSKPVGDPSREVNRPEFTPQVQIPAGQSTRPKPAPGDARQGSPQAPAPQLKDQ